MKQSLSLVALVVRDYDEALDFFVSKLGFVLVEDSPVPAQGKRWVVIAPPGAIESRLLLARASTSEQESRIGSQTGGRVFLFLHTDNFWRDYERYKAQGVVFVRDPKAEPHGTVAVFQDLYGNLWDLVEPASHSGGIGMTAAKHGRMSWNLTPRCRLALNCAQESLPRFAHAHITGAHLILGLLMVPGGVASNLLSKFGLSVESVEAWLASRQNFPEATSIEEGAALGTSALQAFQRAEDEARVRDHTYLGTEHLLLGILAAEDGPATDLFASVKVDREKMRGIIRREMQ